MQRTVHCGVDDIQNRFLGVLSRFPHLPQVHQTIEDGDSPQAHMMDQFLLWLHLNPVTAQHTSANRALQLHHCCVVDTPCMELVSTGHGRHPAPHACQCLLTELNPTVPYCRKTSTGGR